MRLFVAVLLPESVLTALDAVAVKAPSGAVRWTTKSALHVTLKFLGEVLPAQLSPIEHGLTDVARTTPAFPLRLDRGGAFPNVRRPRIFWAGLAGETALLSKLATRLEEELAGLGFPRENRSFSPHITLARVRPDARCPVADAKAIVEASQRLPSIDFPVSSLHLMRSHLGGSSARYESIGSFSLAA